MTETNLHVSESAVDFVYKEFRDVADDRAFDIGDCRAQKIAQWREWLMPRHYESQFSNDWSNAYYMPRFVPVPTARFGRFISACRERHTDRRLCTLFKSVEKFSSIRPDTAQNTVTAVSAALARVLHRLLQRRIREIQIMVREAGIKKALVILSPDLVRPDKPLDSVLLRRAVDLAKMSGCELELFHVCYDGGLQYQLFRTNDELEEQQVTLTDRAATRVAEIAARLKDESVEVRHEVRWDSPRSDAILRKIAQANPDIVIKQARERSFVLGITSNTEWELARRSPAHLWLVHDATEGIERIVAAVGNQVFDSADITNNADYDIFRTADLIGQIFNAEIHPVNAYQVPATQLIATGAAGPMAPTAVPEELQVSRREIVQRHSTNVKAFTKHFGIPADNVHICEGQPPRVIPEMAKAIDADIIVMGSSSIGRLERLISPVTVEPVMAGADCDILVVRERDVTRVPDAAQSPRYGVPKFDLMHAITAPESTFGSPQEVARQSDLSIGFRKRILQAWEYDIRAEMAEENEGGRVGDIDVEILDEIYAAKSLLEMQRDKARDRNQAMETRS